MQTFIEWLSNDHGPMGVDDPIIRIEFNSRRLLLNFSARQKPKDQNYEPQIVVTDKKFINYIMNQLSEDEKLELTNNIPVRLYGDKAHGIIKDNIGRSELGWDHVARYYGLKKSLPLYGEKI